MRVHACCQLPPSPTLHCTHRLGSLARIPGSRRHRRRLASRHLAATLLGCTRRCSATAAADAVSRGGGLRHQKPLLRRHSHHGQHRLQAWSH
jgi:hypothetical protein